MKKASIISLSVIAAVLLIDQALKIWIKTHMMLGEEFAVAGNWFYIHFVENNGMAFGMELGGGWGKMLLSVFRIAAVAVIGVYLIRLCRRTKVDLFFVATVSLVFAGAIGNIVDSVFYGILFDDSLGQVATFLPEGGGYSSLLHGKVVDMFYFPLISGHFPSWMPVWGGQHFLFFRPVFNVADAAISVGMALITLFQKRFFRN